MKSLDSKASKIVGVERENSADARHIHERHESRIVHFNAADGMGGSIRVDDGLFRASDCSGVLGIE
jgi:hypothetical protein